MAVPIASADELPIIDISPLCQSSSSSTGDAAAKAAVVAAIRQACLETGFFYITGHGLDSQPLLSALQQLFDLPLADKAQLDARLSPLHRGYTGLGGAHNCVPAESSVVGPDNKESFLLGAEGSRSPMHGANTWPAIPGWQQQVSAYFSSLTALSRVVARGLALSLGLPEGFFADDKMTDPVAQLLLLRYPPPPPPPPADQQQPGRDADGQGSSGCGSVDSRQPPPFVGCLEHSDCGFLTILAQDEVGLQVRLPSGQWVVAPVVPGAFLVNLGDMTARWTNDLYKSTQHRVFNLSSSRPRHSAVFFCNADFDAMVEPAALDAAVLAAAEAAAGRGELPAAPAGGGAGGASKYAPIKAGHYIMQKLGLMWDEDTPDKANQQQQQ